MVSSMTTFFSFFLVLHIATGFIALVLFWVQAAGRKAGSRHRLIGQYYQRLMWTVVFSAVILCVIRITQGNIVGALFLLFLALITAKPLWIGTKVLELRTNSQRATNLARYNQVALAFNLVIVVTGGAMLLYGLKSSGKSYAVLLMIFGGLGLSNLSDLIVTLKTMRSEAAVDWMKEHIVSMGTSGIAAHTAFLVFGASRLLPNVVTQSSWSFIPWVAPAVVGTILIRRAVNKYQPKQNTKAA